MAPEADQSFAPHFVLQNTPGCFATSQACEEAHVISTRVLQFDNGSRQLTCILGEHETIAATATSDSDLVRSS